MAQPTLIEKVELTEGKLLIPYEKYKLPNGLTIILHEDHSDPIVHVDVTYHVGSSRETPGKSGFAHFFEHMLFQKSDHVAEDEFFNILQEVGGRVNGNTEYDRTKYFETVPSNYLETALWLEADRMGFLLDSVTKTSFENQRKTVTNEKEQNQLNQPYGTVWEVKNQNMYPSDHPYSWPIIGYSDDLERSTEVDLRNFFLRWYGPNNSTLTVAGDIDKAKALEWIEKYFGGINPCPNVKNRMIPRVILAEDKYSQIEDEIFLPLTMMSFPTVPSFHKDEAAMDILSSIMGRGNNSIFYQNFVKTEKAIDASSFNVKQELSGEFNIQVVSFPQETLEETEKLIRSTISDFETNVLNGSDLSERIKTAKAVEISETYDVLGSIQSKAEALSEWEWMLGRTYNLQDRIDAIQSVTNEDVIRVYNKYIKNKKAMIVTVVPRTPVPGEKDFV
ncbi:MAG TPA: peptidase M16, partial [Flavobacteriales bacterium]|nr:peptidase M16 [Flavobacteriales bacterium]